MPGAVAVYSTNSTIALRGAAAVVQDTLLPDIAVMSICDVTYIKWCIWFSAGAAWAGKTHLSIILTFCLIKGAKNIAQTE